MSSYLVDTNIWSEALKREPNERVVSWLRDNESFLYVSTVTIGELKFGIELLTEGDQKEAFQRWLSVLIDRMKGRVVSYNTSVATVWGQIQARCQRNGTRLPTMDSLLAATAVKHSLVIATRNEKDFQHSGVRVVNPFKL